MFKNVFHEKALWLNYMVHLHETSDHFPVATQASAKSLCKNQSLNHSEAATNEFMLVLTAPQRKETPHINLIIDEYLI